MSGFIIDGCVIGGYHSMLAVVFMMRTCDICGAAVCVEHRGIHWERAHSGRKQTVRPAGLPSGVGHTV